MKILPKKKFCVAICSLLLLLALAFGFAFQSPVQADAGSVVTLETFTMQTGASVRMDAPYGIRFTTQISETEYESLGDNAVFGTLILPANILGDRQLDLTTATALKAKNIIAEIWNDALAEELKNDAGESVKMKAYTGVIVGSLEEDFPETQFGREMAARGYVTYTDEDGVRIRRTRRIRKFAPSRTSQARRLQTVKRRSFYTIFAKRYRAFTISLLKLPQFPSTSARVRRLRFAVRTA